MRAAIWVGQSGLKWSIVTVFVTFGLQMTKYTTPWLASSVDALWFASVVVMAYLTRRTLKGLQADKTFRRRTLRATNIVWRLTVFAFGSTSLLLMFRPFGYTTDDIVMTAVQLLSPVALTAIAMRAAHLASTSISPT